MMIGHQKRLWREMIGVIDGYLNGSGSDFAEVVGKLQGAMDAAELHDAELRRQWYTHWTPLEIRRASGDSGELQRELVAELAAMRDFLVANEPQ
jgi:hypothetical protein